ncbi:MAG TPA: alpha-amylase family glycosyl hydrolase [Pyrinomonadaceae bacterium]|nr:family 10 glycosylhydrolase [Acidobacteriota bacterium]HQZ95262.1 alpha-amylase family glycosyl hydrolase [Pyrinomonadaceae bacterium]
MQKRILILSVISIFLASCVFGQQPSRDVSKETARSSQDWIRDAVIYQIWERAYSQKGDFNSITADLDRIKNLGADVLWLMPVHPIGQVKKKGSVGSPYAVRDYYGVNPDYGTPADLKRLVAEAHKRGLKVIIDVVVNHTAWDNKLITEHPEFYKKNEKGEIIPPVPDWADVAGLDYEKPAVRKYIIENFKSWIRDYDLDGFRCDVALFIPTDFWEEARAEVDKVKANTIWLAEAEKADLLVKAFDVDYSWNMHGALTEVMQGVKPASALRRIWEEQAATFAKGSIRMRFSDNHDERRAIVRFGEKGALAAQTLAFTLDGVPLIYNGMEVGDTAESGAPALFEKLPIFWQFAERRPEFPRFYKAMTSLRKSSVALRRGDVNWLKNSDENRVLTFTRRSGNEELLIAINMTNAPFFGSVEASGNFEEITPNIGNPLPPDDEKSKPPAKANVALPTLSLDSFGFRIFKRK